MVVHFRAESVGHFAPAEWAVHFPQNPQPQNLIAQFRKELTLYANPAIHTFTEAA